jgi:hypothetical protein
VVKIVVYKDDCYFKFSTKFGTSAFVGPVLY